jgi:hypothetical protein
VDEEHAPDLPPFLLPAPHTKENTDVLLPVQEAGLAIKKLTQKNLPKKPTKNVFFLVFWGFF